MIQVQKAMLGQLIEQVASQSAGMRATQGEIQRWVSGTCEYLKGCSNDFDTSQISLMTTAIDIEISPKRGEWACQKCQGHIEQERQAFKSKQAELIAELEQLRSEMAQIIASGQFNQSSYSQFGAANGGATPEQRNSNVSPSFNQAQPQQQPPKENNLEEALQPFLENIHEVGDEVYFMCNGKIYKIAMHADEMQEGDLDDLKQNLEAQVEAEAQVIYL